jgi:hypothetical protein
MRSETEAWKPRLFCGVSREIYCEAHRSRQQKSSRDSDRRLSKIRDRRQRITKEKIKVVRDEVHVWGRSGH